MKKILDRKWSLILTPVISAFFFVTIITAAPIQMTDKMNSEEIKTIAVVSAEVAKTATDPQAKVDPQAVASAVKAPTTVASSNPAQVKPKSTSAPVKKVQPQPSRSSNISTKPSNPKPTATAKPAPNTKASAIIATGKQYIGVKYVYGGTTPAGFDCSGFVKYVFAKHGVSLPRVSRDQFKVGTSVSFSNLKSGDLVFFSLAKNGVVDHVGIYVGNGQFINASSSKGVTIYTLGTYWKSAYLGAKRVL